MGPPEEAAPPSPLAEGDVSDEAEPSADPAFPPSPLSALLRGGIRDHDESAGVGIERGAQAVSSDWSTAGGAEGTIGDGVDEVGGGCCCCCCCCCGAAVAAEEEDDEDGFGVAAAAVVAAAGAEAGAAPVKGPFAVAPTAALAPPPPAELARGVPLALPGPPAAPPLRARARAPPPALSSPASCSATWTSSRATS